MHWPVPATDDDVAKIPQGAFRRLPGGDARYRGFTHTLEKRPDGKCAFLASDNRCELHTARGIDAKPAMCKLFPYSFTPTPTGFYLYVSFASSGVIANSGRLLTDQEPEMREQLELFQRLFAHVDGDWSGAQLIDGVPLAWQDFIALEQEATAPFETRQPRLDTIESLLRFSRLIQSSLPRDVDTERLPPVAAGPQDVDKLLLATLAKLYWPEDVFSNGVFDLDGRALMSSLVLSGSAATVTIFGVSTLSELRQSRAQLTDDAEDLLNRWVYSRLFAKLYFGRAYAHLSLLAGVHHLLAVVALVRMHAKAVGANSLFEVGEILRTVERRMSQMNFSRESCAMLEILLCSASRAERVHELAR